MNIHQSSPSRILRTSSPNGKMNLFLTLVSISAVLIKINAQCSVNNNCQPPGTVCAVGESDLAQGGFCQQANGDNACKSQCEKSYGAELVKAECSAARPNGQRECICQLKCQNGGCWGDPHCWSWDGTQFGYQSLKPYHVFKPINKFPTLPQFEIIQSNHPWQGSAMATVDTVNLIVIDWGQNVKVVAPPNGAFVITVNDKPVTIPFRFSDIKGNIEHYIDLKYSDASHLVIMTSFGVIISIHSNGAYSDVSIDIPRHPELKGNTGGVLGRWNDNPADDNLDANGQAQALNPTDSTGFGNTWLVPGEKLPTQAELDEDKALHDQHVQTFNKEHWDHLIKMCDSNINTAEMKHCMKQLGRPPHVVDDCALDLSHIIEEADQQAYLKAKVDSFKQRCPQHQLNFVHHPRPKHIPNHKPVHFFRPHYAWGPAKPEHYDRCFMAKEFFQMQSINLMDCLAFEGWFEEQERFEGRRHPFLPHHKWGRPKPHHRDRCFQAKERFQMENVNLMECLAFEGWLNFY